MCCKWAIGGLGIGTYWGANFLFLVADSRLVWLEPGSRLLGWRWFIPSGCIGRKLARWA